MADEVDDTTGPSEPKKRLIVNWHMCILCQADKDERLQCPGNTKRYDGGAGYRTLSDDLHSIIKLDKQSIPVHLSILYKDDQDDCFEEPFTRYYAKWHNTCRANYSKSRIGRIERRLSGCNSAKLDAYEDQNCNNTYRRSNENTASTPEECFFCGDSSNNESLHDVTTFEVDARVRTCANALSDSRILAKLSVGDLIALEAKYHTRCLVSFYNRAQRHQEGEKLDSNSHEFAMCDAIVFAELISHIEELRYESNVIHPLRLADLTKMYQNRLTQQGITSDQRVNSTRLKERLLNHFPDLTAHSTGRDIYLAFDEDMSGVLKELSNRGATEDAIHLMRAAQIIRRDLFEHRSRFTGSFPDDCETKSVPNSLLSLVRMILEGPSIKDQVRTDKIPGSLTISQLMMFNAVKYSREEKKPQSFRHNSDRETPLPVYIGMLLHSHTRKRELVDKLYDLGLCISYDRVLRLSSALANEACHQFHEDDAVCPLSLRHGLFTTAAADNLDHNPSSTTSKDSFHGTGISLTQHPTHQSGGTCRDTVILTENHQMRRKTVDPLPLAYSVVKPVATTAIKPTIPKVDGSITPNRQSESQAIHEEAIWLEEARQATEGDIEVDNISWAAYHSNMQSQLPLPRAIDVLLPMFPDNAHSVSMVRHTMEVVEKSISFLNPGQVPVITFDQPLYALAKEIQWRWPKQFGEDKFVIFLGGLHIEMSMLKVIGDLLQGSGWVELLTQADIASPGQAESYIQASHVTRTRHAHQISAVGIYTLQKRAYSKYCQGLTQDEDALQFQEWCTNMSREHPQFRYWSLVLDLQLSMLVFVRSIRESNFILYREALNSFCKWFFAFDHVHYARWVPVHVRDLMQLEQKHPVVAENFHGGMFTVTKTERPFSAMSMDQAHEQNNKCVKGDGGAVGLTQDPAALLRWMVAGPEVARVIGEFEDQHMVEVKETESKHHEQQPSIQAKFKTDVESVVEVMEGMGNPFDDRGSDLYNIDSKVIADQSVVTTIDKLKQLGEAQHSAFVRDRLQQCTVSFNDAVKRNKLPLFTSTQKQSASAGKKKLESVKSDCALFSKLYIGCQLRDGDLDEFFTHENQSYPPSLSDMGALRQGSKSDLLPCLEKMTKPTVEDPEVSAKMIDSAVVVQMLQPGNAKTFDQYAQQVFIPYVLAQFADTYRIDLVWDTYTSDSLKSAARQKRGTGIRRRVVSSAAIPRNWKDFLRVDENKTELFSYLANEIINHGIIPDGKQLVSTDGQSVLSSPSLDDVSSISPCSHEEADTRLLLHTRHAASNGCSKILIRTVDTDVVVLAVSAMHTLDVDELWLAIGTGKNLRYLAIHDLYSQFGSNMSLALPFFHSLTGCDTVSSFAYHGKKSAFDAWMSFPGITDTFKALSSTVADISEANICELERFVTLMYDHTCKTSSVNEARKHLFTKKGRPMERIPPTKAALVQHIRRAVLQAGWVWGQLMVKSPEIPSPSDWGWVKRDDGWHPLWTTIPDAAQSCRELVRCGCKAGCGARCKCLKAKLPCTNMCHCDGLCNRI